MPDFPLDTPAASLDPLEIKEWMGPVGADRTYNLGVIIPHLMDIWWVSVLYGLIDEARLNGADITVYVAGGYGEVTRQISQVEAFIAEGVDLLIAAPVSFGALVPVLEEAQAAGIPVLAFVNDTTLAHPEAKVLASYYLTYGRAAGEIAVDHYLASDKSGEVVQMAIFPGPGGLAWTGATELGIKDYIADAGLADNFDIVEVKWGVSEKAVQIALIEPVLLAHPELDYIVGCGPAAEAAVLPVEAAGRAGKTHIISTDITQPLYFAIKDGTILAAPAEYQQFTARLAVDAAVRILNGEEPGVDFPFRAAPLFGKVNAETIGSLKWEHLFEPEGWDPVFRYRVPEGLRVD
jgi:protein TorT